nr:40s ribosomal protein s30-a [Quercus suber]
MRGHDVTDAVTSNLDLSNDIDIYHSRIDGNRPNSNAHERLPLKHKNTTNMGKVHGSLARAGKVKSQTPKVEPQEKKKTPKGRAKKRLTYTRRFINVTMTGGKRKMNPNPTS